MIGHSSIAQKMSNLVFGDTVEIEGNFTPYHWKGRDRKERFVANVEATKISVLCLHNKNQTI